MDVSLVSIVEVCHKFGADVLAVSEVDDASLEGVLAYGYLAAESVVEVL